MAGQVSSCRLSHTPSGGGWPVVFGGWWSAFDVSVGVSGLIVWGNESSLFRLPLFEGSFCSKCSPFLVFAVKCRQLSKSQIQVDTWVLHIPACLKSVHWVAVTAWAGVPELWAEAVSCFESIVWV